MPTPFSSSTGARRQQLAVAVHVELEARGRLRHGDEQVDDILLGAVEIAIAHDGSERVDVALSWCEGHRLESYRIADQGQNAVRCRGLR